MRKDAASREEMLGMVLGGSVAGRQLRHSAADRQLLQGLAQVLLAGENAGHAVQRLADLDFFVRSVDAGIGLVFHMTHLRPITDRCLNCKMQITSVKKTAAPDIGGAA